MDESAVRIDVGLRDAYLRRLGLEAEPPSVDALQRLHRRQVELIPYETLWMQSGERWGVDPVDSVARIALHGRGGYCYHLNGACGHAPRWRSARPGRSGRGLDRQPCGGDRQRAAIE
ncbi:MAG: hypothetical protein E6G39_12815 [Actinobacteria bacterium]|nr:MAG: hypothetical protein E6G39_12815 [Actinomycetota bacterium]